MRCEDYPCCGHEAGCCPDYDDDGRQVDMKCVCGASVPLTSHTSLCPTCLRSGDDDRYDHLDERDDDVELDDDGFEVGRYEMEDQHLDGMYEE